MMDTFDLLRACSEFSSIPTSRLAALWELISIQRDQLPDGAFVQCGVWKGGSAALIARALEQGNRKKLAIHLFDSWDGLPPPTQLDGEKAAAFHVNAEWEDGSIDDVFEIWVKTGCRNRIVNYQGWLSDTLPKHANDIGDIAVLHIDVDWHDSTVEVLTHLYDRVVDGGLIIFDDYGHWQGTRIAVDEFWTERALPGELYILDTTARFFIKPHYDLDVRGEPEAIIDYIEEYRQPKVRNVLQAVRSYIPGIKLKREVSEFQAAALFALAKGFNYPTARILEIGTAVGYSAAIMAEGCQGKIRTLNPDSREVPIAQCNLARYGKRVEVIETHSQTYLDNINSIYQFDMIFVDGDHKHVNRDLPYWNLLRNGGLMLFHDYSPPGSWRACPPVFDLLNHIRDNVLKRDFDVLVRDEDNVGLAGWYRRPGELMPVFPDEWKPAPITIDTTTT